MYFLSSKVPQSNFRCHRLGKFIYDSCRGIRGPSAALGYLFDDDGKSVGRARTLFTGGFQLRQSIPPPAPPPLIDCRPASRQVLLPFPTLPFPPVGPGIPVSHVLSARLQAPLRPARLPAPLPPAGPHPPMVSVQLHPIPQHLASTSLYTFHSIAFPSSQLDL